MNTQKKTGTAALLAALAMTGAVTARGADVGTDYLGDPSLMVAVTGGSESRTHENGSGTYGAVSYDYSIGKYEVTNAQYAKFLNAVGVTTTDNDLLLYNPEQLNYGLTWSGDQFGGDNRPVVYVSLYDAMRFVNWLTNGGTTDSDTESGLYAFSGVNTLTSTPDHATSTGWVIANQNEWYRAAYYNGEGGFWDYATQSNDHSGDRDASNGQNSKDSGNGNVALEAGSFIYATSFFGTYDQGANVCEWNEERVVRGGGFNNVESITAYDNPALGAANQANYIGFRVVRLMAVPEPGMVAGVLGGVALVIGVWVRRSRRTL
ncbi:MAG: formylglycine-generating enzyme family protein [Opitutaceae bacterium]|nr:formylglycine-generating enzyme family protein [Opitutaceae bacterium]